MPDLRLFDLTHRTALVTGSSQGIGLALARGLGRAGASVVLNGRDETKLAEANRGVPGSGMVDWAAVFASLDTIAFNGAVTLSAEARLDEVLEEGLPLLREKAGRFTLGRS